MTLSNQLKWHLSAIHSPIVDGLPLCKREIKINPHKCQDNSMGERRYIVCYVVIKKKKKYHRGWEYGSVVKHLLSVWEDLCSIPSTTHT